MYKKIGNETQITLTNQEFDKFLFLVGYCIGSLDIEGQQIKENAKFNKEVKKGMLRLLDKMNEGNPLWADYKEYYEENKKTTKKE